MTIKDIKKNKGFVILFAVTISAILLSITLGVISVAFRELRFGTSGRDTNDAFFAADTGIECALRHDRSSSVENAFTGSATINCGGSAIALFGSAPTWTFVVVGLGSTGSACAKVTVYKDTVSNPPYTYTAVTSKGYNIGDSLCASSSSNRIEREIKLNY